MLFSSGKVYKYSATDDTLVHLFSTIAYDDGFDLKSLVSIYSLDNIIVIVNNLKTSGYVYHPSHGRIALSREDYHAKVSGYPIAMFKDEEGVPHLIYSEAWNHVQIMNLDTLQVLTATKSLIEEGAEEKHLEFYEKYAVRSSEPSVNTSPWPARYNYFYGPILMSPDNKHFLSKGWVWGSRDVYRIYEVADFIANGRIRDQTIDYLEHCSRSACWLDNNTIVLSYDANEEDEENATVYTPKELRFYDLSSNEPIIVKRFVFDVFNEMPHELYYYKPLNCLVALHKKKGLACCTMDGELIFRHKTFKPGRFFSEQGLFIRYKGSKITVHQLA